ncbi:OmpA family protein [bacterium]|nr:OmpA family protein [bacterium]RQV98538.1 MAG: hypothetical protein EH221_01680 [bacterium]
MKGAIITLSTVLTIILGADAYLYFDQYKPTQEANQQIQVTNMELERKAAILENELNLKVAEISKEREAKEKEIARVESAKDSLITEMEKEIQDNQIQITQLADKLKVSIVDRILFPSGEADISPEGLLVLERVGNILKNMKDKIVRVEGHTDNVPISSRLQEKFPSNWELSTARATNVVRFLQEKVAIDPSRLEAVGLGEHQPVASNETKEGQAQNRRIEIALLPIQ